MIRLAVILFLALGESGCVSMLFGSPKAKSQAYTFAPPPAPWHKIDAGSADVAYQYPGDRSLISLNSVCNQYQDQSLEDLTKEVSLGISDQRKVATASLQIAGFPALRTTTTGTLESVPVSVHLTIVRSTHCVYDFLLVARQTAIDAHRETYDRLVQEFREGSSP